MRQVFLLLVPLAFYHSWHVWQYSYIGVVLWLYNRWLQWRQSRAASRVLSAAALPGAVTHLVITSGGAIAAPRAGQFVYLCIPEIDPCARQTPSRLCPLLPNCSVCCCVQVAVAPVQRFVGVNDQFQG